VREGGESGDSAGKGELGLTPEAAPRRSNTRSEAAPPFTAPKTDLRRKSVREEKEHREGKMAEEEKEYREPPALLALPPPRWIHASCPRSPARPRLRRSPGGRTRAGHREEELAPVARRKKFVAGWIRSPAPGARSRAGIPIARRRPQRPHAFATRWIWRGDLGKSGGGGLRSGEI